MYFDFQLSVFGFPSLKDKQSKISKFISVGLYPIGLVLNLLYFDFFIEQ